MNEPEDDTTETHGDAPDARDAAEDAPRRRRPGAYYYDDATGYEPYDPASDEEENEGEYGEGEDSDDDGSGS